MKGVFLYSKKINYNLLSGIDKKVLSQVKVLNSNGIECKIVELNSGIKDEGSFLDKILFRMPYSNMHPKWEYTKYFDRIDFLYFRRPASITYHTLNMLRKIRKNNPQIRIIMEIPTFPYDQELKMTWKDYPIYWKDKHNRKKLKGLVDRIALISGEDISSVFGIKTLKLYNGVDLDNIKTKLPINDDVIDLCAVAMFAKWHGYDRVIKGMGEYYRIDGRRQIQLHMVGKGYELDHYKQLVKGLNLTNYVTFYGVKNGDELEEIYNKADIGLDVFGMFRKGLSIAYSLKSREYLAKGLPIVSGCPIDIFQKKNNYKYYLEFENEDEPIDIYRLIKFYDDIYKNSYENTISNIRSFAEKTCDISVAMREIINYLK